MAIENIPKDEFENSENYKLTLILIVMIEKDRKFEYWSHYTDLDILKIASTCIKFDPVDKKKSLKTRLKNMIELDGFANEDRKGSKKSLLILKIINPYSSHN